MTSVDDIYNYIDSFAPFSASADFDNTGILIGDKNAAVTKVVVALDITTEVVDEAVELNAELIISHHPIIFNPLKKIESSSVPAKMIRSNLSAICAHTNLDLSPVFGVNTVLAEACGLVNCRFCESSECLFVAVTEEKLSAVQLAEKIKRGLNCERLAYSERTGLISKVGICSGAGGSEVFSAAAEGCDAFITGEIKHHELLFAKENNMAVFYAGHYKSEDIITESLAMKLGERFNSVRFIKSHAFTDGIKFL